MQVVHRLHCANTVAIQPRNFPNGKLYIHPLPCKNAFYKLDVSRPTFIIYILLIRFCNPLFFYYYSILLVWFIIIKNISFNIYWMSTSVIGAFRHSAVTLLGGMTVSISTRKQEETWGLCLISRSIEKLGFKPRSV